MVDGILVCILCLWSSSLIGVLDLFWMFVYCIIVDLCSGWWTYYVRAIG